MSLKQVEGYRCGGKQVAEQQLVEVSRDSTPEKQKSKGRPYGVNGTCRYSLDLSVYIYRI